MEIAKLNPLLVGESAGLRTGPRWPPRLWVKSGLEHDVVGQTLLPPWEDRPREDRGMGWRPQASSAPCGAWSEDGPSPPGAIAACPRSVPSVPSLSTQRRQPLPTRPLVHCTVPVAMVVALGSRPELRWGETNVCGTSASPPCTFLSQLASVQEATEGCPQQGTPSVQGLWRVDLEVHSGVLSRVVTLWKRLEAEPSQSGPGQGRWEEGCVVPGWCAVGTHWEMVPVVLALITHCRSVILKGTRTMLTFSPSSRKLSGYTRWWVVLLPTSASNPAVGALFILGEEGRESAVRLGVTCPGVAGHRALALDAPRPGECPLLPWASASSHGDGTAKGSTTADGLSCVTPTGLPQSYHGP